MFKFIKTSIMVFLAALSSGQAAETADVDPQLKPGVNEIYITQKDGLKRQILIELPTEINPNGHPVVIGLHGAGGSHNAYNRRLKPFVNQYGLISVSPLGSTSPDGVTAWTFIKKGALTSADDVGLMKDIVALLDKQGLVDHRRIYVTGSSSGGLMSYRLARETKLFAAIGPAKCGMTKGAHEPLTSTNPISIMQVIGDVDKSFNGSNNQHPMYSAKERIDIWSKFNACKNPTFTDHGEWTSTHYMCADNKEIELTILKGVGHGLGKEWTVKTDKMLIEFLLKQTK